MSSNKNNFREGQIKRVNLFFAQSFPNLIYCRQTYWPTSWKDKESPLRKKSSFPLMI